MVGPARLGPPARPSGPPIRSPGPLPPRTLWIDIGGVVIGDPRPIVVEALARRGGASRTSLRRAYYRWSRALDRDRIPLAEMHRRLRRAFSIRIGWAGFRELVERKSLRPVPRVLPALRALRRTGRVRIVFASNISRAGWRGSNERFGLGDLADDAVLSFRLGTLKPSRAFFREALRRTGAKGAPVLYLDDTIANVRSARSLGIDARQVRRPEETLRLLRRLHRPGRRVVAPAGRPPISGERVRAIRKTV